MIRTICKPAGAEVNFRLPDEYMGEEIEILVFPVREAVNTMIDARADARPVFGCLKGQIHMADDFDEPLEDFKDYM